MPAAVTIDNDSATQPGAFARSWPASIRKRKRDSSQRWKRITYSDQSIFDPRHGQMCIGGACLWSPLDHFPEFGTILCHRSGGCIHIRHLYDRLRCTADDMWMYDDHIL